MAKFVCVFALAGMAAGVPAAYRVPAADQEVVVNRIMVGLQPAIDDAIARALSGLYSSSGSVSYGVGQTSNAGYGSSINQGFSASNQGFSASNQGFSASNQGASRGTTSHFQSAGLNGVVYHDGSSTAVTGGQQQQAVNSAQFTSSQTSSVSSASQQQKIVQGVMTALVPQIEAAVQSALASQQQQQQQTSVSTFSTSSQVNSQEEQALVSRIISVLTPSITTSVRNALAARVQTVQVQAVPVTTVTQSTTSSSAVDTSTLIAQIISALKPSIAVSVEQALASRASSAQAFQGASNNVGFSSQSASTGFNGASASSGSLTSIFGDGKAHNVKVQTPEYSIEYNN